MKYKHVGSYNQFICHTFLKVRELEEEVERKDKEHAIEIKILQDQVVSCSPFNMHQLFQQKN